MIVRLEPKKGSTLHDFPYASSKRKCLHAWVINITPSGLAHCKHHCVYCYAREALYSDLGSDQKVYSNLPELVEHDLRRIDLCPPVSISNTTDPCQDVVEVRQEVTRLISTLMRYGVAFSIITKGDPSFLLEVPGFVSYGPKFIAVTVEGPAEVLKLLSPGAPGFEARLGAVKHLSQLGVATSIRLDPVIVHVWKALYGSAWLDQVEILAQRFADAGARHVVSSTGRLDKRRPRWPDGSQRESMWQRLVKIIEKQSPAAAQEFQREYCDSAETSRGLLLRKDLRLAFHRHARGVFEAQGMTYATCQELTAAEADSTGIPHCEGLPTPFSRKGPDGRFHPIEGCSANCHVSCRNLTLPPCGQPALVKPAPYTPSELTQQRPARRGRQVGLSRARP